MSELDDINPYLEELPELREAWRRGFQACVRDDPRLPEQAFDDKDTAWAWLEGYAAAEGREEN